MLNFPKTCAQCGAPWSFNHECTRRTKLAYKVEQHGSQWLVLDHNNDCIDAFDTLAEAFNYVAWLEGEDTSHGQQH